MQQSDRLSVDFEANDGAVITETWSRARSQMSLNDQIHQKLRWNLASGVYKPNQRLSTRTLAIEFGTSAMPVREALKRLVAERILIVESNSGYRIPIIDRNRGIQLFEIRKILEGFATRYAVPRLSAIQLDLLAKVDNDMIAAIERKDLQGYFAGNYSFHFLIYSAADNPDLVALIEGLWMQIGPFYTSMLDVGSYNKGWKYYHTDIISAIRSGDADLAAAAVERDVDSAKNYFLANNGNDSNP